MQTMQNIKLYSESGIEIRKGTIVKTKKGELIGVVKHILKTPSELKRIDTKLYNLYLVVEKEKKGYNYERWCKKFPLILVGRGTRIPYDIFHSELKKYKFEKSIRDSKKIFIDEVKKKIKAIDYSKYKYVTHRTPYWRNCLKVGVLPETSYGTQELYAIKEKYSMWVGNKICKESVIKSTRIWHVGGGSNDGIIVAERKGYIKPLYKVLEKNNQLSIRLLTIFESMANWFISFKVVPPSAIVRIYSPSGKILYDRKVKIK